MIQELLKVLIIILVIMSSISVISILGALLLTYLDKKGIIDKISNLFSKRGKKEWKY